MDAAGVTHRLEDAYRQMWHHWCEAHSPGKRQSPWCAPIDGTSHRSTTPAREEAVPRRRFAFRFLEMHVAHACNLTCESCSHFSNQGHKGTLSVDDSVQWMSA